MGLGWEKAGAAGLRAGRGGEARGRDVDESFADPFKDVASGSRTEAAGVVGREIAVGSNVEARRAICLHRPFTGVVPGEAIGSKLGNRL